MASVIVANEAKERDCLNGGLKITGRDGLRQ